MLHYTDEKRGTFQNEEQAKRLVSFEGMKYEGRAGVLNVTPTDVDGYIQLDVNNVFIFFELKHSGKPPDGQGKALEKLVDAVDRAGDNSVLFVAHHNTEGKIVAKDAVVSAVYWKCSWHHAKKGYLLGKAINEYIKYINKIKKEETCQE